ncbi:MAG: hypothetical protein R3E66_03265 [bacterium]
MIRFNFALMLGLVSLNAMACNTFSDLDPAGVSNNSNTNSATNNAMSNNETNNANTNNSASNNSNTNNSSCLTTNPGESAVFPTLVANCGSPDQSREEWLEADPVNEDVTAIALGLGARQQPNVFLVTDQNVSTAELILDSEVLTRGATSSWEGFPLQTVDEVYNAPFVADEGFGDFLSISGSNCRSSESEKHFYVMDARQDQVGITSGQCIDDSPPTHLFGLGSAGLRTEPGDEAGFYVWLEDKEGELTLNSLPVHDLSPGQVLAVPEPKLTANSVVRSTTGDLVAFTSTEGVLGWNARARVLGPSCGEDIERPILSPNAPTTPLAFDITYMGDNAYVFAVASVMPTFELKRVYYNPATGFLDTETLDYQIVFRANEQITAVRLAAFSGGFMLFVVKENPTSLTNDWEMIPYFQDISGKWVPGLSQRVSGRWTTTDLHDVHFRVVDSGCTVEAIYAALYTDSQGTKTHTEAVRFVNIYNP